MIRGHGGNIHELARDLGCSPGDIIDMSSNTNPLGPMPELIEHLEKNIDAINALPEVDGNTLLEAFSTTFNIDVNRLSVGNGTTQFIFSSPLALDMKKALILNPTYADYGDACRVYNVGVTCAPAEESNLFQPDIGDVQRYLKDADTVFICNPNNPTGRLIEKKDLIELCKSLPDIRFIIDESYLPFTERYDESTMIHGDLPNLVVLHSFSKIFCIPGLRLGFLVASPQIAESFRDLYQPWSVNSLAQVAGHFLLGHISLSNSFFKRTQAFIAHEQQLIAERLMDTPALKVFPSVTSFVLFKIRERLDAAQLYSSIAKDRILLRNCSNFEGLSNRFFRISLKSSEINARIARRLIEIFA